MEDQKTLDVAINVDGWKIDLEVDLIKHLNSIILVMNIVLLQNKNVKFWLSTWVIGPVGNTSNKKIKEKVVC